MNPTSLEISIAITLATVAIALVAWFLRYKASGTERRMKSMFLRAGLDPDIALDDDKNAVIKGIRQRCKKCQTEDVCERWLADKIKGDNDFCPNAEIFGLLSGKSVRAV